MSTPARKVKASLVADFTIPPEAMYGRLREIALSQGIYEGWVYGASLAVFAGRYSTFVNREQETRAQVFVALLGPPNDGKSTALRRAIRVLNPKHVGIIDTDPASDRALYQMFPANEDDDREPPNMLLALDEMLIMLKKMAIRGSTLAPVFCKLFYDDVSSAASKKGLEKLKARLSICGALKCSGAEDFKTAFGDTTDNGLYDRFIFVPPPLKPLPIRRNWKAKLAKIEPGAGALSEAQSDLATAWQESPATEIQRQGRKRLQELALRVACITASANGEDVVSPECLQAALVFAEWQECIRTGGFSPSQSQNLQAELTEKIIASFRLLSVSGQVWIRWRTLYKNKDWRNRYGSEMLNRTFASLQALGDIEAQLDEDKEKTGLYQLASDFFPKKAETIND